jgi:hypothetical protein
MRWVRLRCRDQDHDTKVVWKNDLLVTLGDL